MKTVMSASDDGYAYVKEETSESTYEEKDGEHSRIIYQTTHGVYNVKEDDLYGKQLKRLLLI